MFKEQYLKMNKASDAIKNQNDKIPNETNAQQTLEPSRFSAFFNHPITQIVGQVVIVMGAIWATNKLLGSLDAEPADVLIDNSTGRI